MLQIAVEMLPSSTFSQKTETQLSQQHETTPAEKFEMELPVVKSKDPGPMEKAPSNVRKMISAFESGQLKDVKSLKRPASVLPAQKVARKEHSVKGQDEKGVAQSNNQSLRKAEVAHLTKNLSENLKIVSGQEDLVSSVSHDLDSSHTEPSLVPEDLESTGAPMELSGEESDRSTVYLTSQPVSETATCSGREYEVQSQEIEFYDSSDPSAVEEESEPKTRLESSKLMDIQGTSDQKPESLDFDKEEHNSPESSGLWIFPHNVGRLCITTAGNQVMKIVELQHIEASTHQEKEVSLESEILEQQHEIHETDIKMPVPGSFPDDSCNILIWQAIKIAVILGFGVLVLLTRKKEPRRKKSEENDFLFSIPNHIDDRTLTE